MSQLLHLPHSTRLTNADAIKIFLTEQIPKNFSSESGKLPDVYGLLSFDIELANNMSVLCKSYCDVYVSVCLFISVCICLWVLNYIVGLATAEFYDY